ncbi:NAD/NADP-dependent octopine/nopaline dehydrogenase family protein [Solibaculum mannosilyticum]|uniref:NAD/NADP-dependent octopine/nopaline dehydrogenase family protein n=1 Tax=Solibaculum mannosilyticum TaxID=2780922 RepID=UPI0007A86F8B|nr:Opine dehydrogenase [Eubacteriaceae bacterium CHKCI005]
MKVCVIGGGNIGTAMAAIISSQGHSVTIKTGKPDLWSHQIQYIDMESHQLTSAHIAQITSDASVIADADMLFVTVPSFSLAEIAKEIQPYLKKTTPLGIIPGTGGMEFFLKPFIEQGYPVFGLDRVPCIARLIEYGKSVTASKKTSVRLGCFNYDKKELCKKVGSLLGLSCLPLDNYLTVTFTPSNPILHTARLYALYQNASPDHCWQSNVPFYEDWDDLSSQILIACDQELQNICSSITELDLSGVIPLTVHYESATVETMTKKISNILAFKGIPSPMVLKDGHYILDLQSRYFTEDFPFGLCILKGFAEIFHCSTPSIDKVLQWYQDISGQLYLTESGWNGPDLKNTAIPQNFGITTPTDVYQLYS